MKEEGKPYGLLLVFFAMMFVFSAVPLSALAGSREVWLEEDDADITVHEYPVSVVENDPADIASDGTPATTPSATIESLYSDSAVDQASAPATQVTGAPDDVRHSFAGTGAFVRGSGSTWGAGSGTITMVEIASEWSSSGLINDGAQLRYFDSSISAYGATQSASIVTNFASDNTLYLDVTADKASWTWADIGQLHPQLSYVVAGQPDTGASVSCDAVWLRVTYDSGTGDMVQNIPVHLGWNLVSVIPTFTDGSLLSVLDDDGGDTAWSAVQSYDAANGWKVYSKDAPPMACSLKSADNTMGLWVEITDAGSDGTLQVRGSQPDFTQIPLHAGWNLVGYPSVEERTVAEALAGVPFDMAQKYDGASPYNLADLLPTETMSAGNGYWIHLTADALWTVYTDDVAPAFAGIASATDVGTGGAVDLSWGTASDPSSPITYNIYQALSSGGQNFASPTYTTTDTAFQVTGLTNGLPHYFVVRAEDSLGNEDANTVEKSATPTIPATPPQVVSTVPASGVTGVAISTTIQITFTEAMNQASVQSAFSITPVAAGVFSWDVTSSIMTFTPSASLGYSTAHACRVLGTAQDQQGETLDGDNDGTMEGTPVDDHSWSFTTVTAPDLTGPITSSVLATPNPTEGAASVTLTASISDVTTGNSNIVQAEYFVDTVGADGSGIVMNAADGSFNSPTEGVTVAISVSGWPVGSYTLYVHGRDSAGNWGLTTNTVLDVTVAPDTTPPYIMTTTPISAATGVALAQSVVITFSETIDTATFAISCTPNPGGWSPVWSTATYPDDRVTLAHANFAYGTTYSFTVTAADDLAGNGLTTGPVPNPWSFTTVSAPDTTGPITSSVVATPDPTNGAASVTLTASISDVTTGNSNIAQAEYFVDTVGADGSGIVMNAADGSFNSPTEGVTVAISVSGWPVGTYTLYVHGRDSAGNWGGTANTVLDVTAVPDTIPPQVVSNTPANGATGVLVGGNIVVVFTEAMNQGNTQGAYGVVPSVTGAFSWNAGGDTMTFNPTANLAYSTLYTITILTAATDLAGNTLDGDKDGVMEGDNKDKWVFSFTTGAEPDTTGPQIITTTPVSAATGVAITQSIIITFSESINTGTLAYSCTPNPGGWGATWSTVNYANDRVTLTHASFLYSTSYTFSVSAAQDTSGNALVAGPVPNPWSFTTGANPDATGPIVSSVVGTPNPIALGATLTLTASVSDVTTGNNNIAQAEWSRGASAAAAGAGTAMSATDGSFNAPTEAVTTAISTTGWTEGANTLWVRGRDVVGNWGNAVSTSVTVTVPDTIPPQVTTNTPANGATGILVTANVIVDFSEPMNQANTQGAWSIVPSVAGAFSWNAGGDILTFNPTADLAASTTYTVTILTAATDLAGNTLDGDKDGVMEGDNKDKWVFSFTTAGGASVERYAVCVGINKYDYQNDLTYCVNDANECRTNLLGAGYSVNLLTDGQATKVAILAALTAMGTSEVAGDYTAFTYSGHGGTSGGLYFICPEDCYYIEDMITDDEMNAIFDLYDSTHQLLFFDSCNSGGLGLGATGRLHIMAAAANQYSWDGQPDIANGVWTYFFWEDGYRLGGAASTVLETVFTYAKPLATAYVDVNYGYSMTPQISDGYTGSFYL